MEGTRKGINNPPLGRKGGENMNPVRFEWQTRCEFNAYCKHSLRNELIDALRERKSRKRREVNFSDLAPHEEKQLYTVDRYFVNEEEEAFCVGGLKITAKLLADALHYIYLRVFFHILPEKYENKDTPQPLYLRGVRFCAIWQSTFSRQSLLFLKSAVRLLPGTDIVDAYLYVISFCTISGLFAASLCALDSLFRSNDFKYAAINTVAKDKMDDMIFIQSRSAK